MPHYETDRRVLELRRRASLVPYLENPSGLPHVSDYTPDSKMEFLNWGALSMHEIDLMHAVSSGTAGNSSIIHMGIEHVVTQVPGDKRSWASHEVKWKNDGALQGVRARASQEGDVKVDIMEQGSWMSLFDYIEKTTPERRKAWRSYVKSLGIEGYATSFKETVAFAVAQQVRK